MVILIVRVMTSEEAKTAELQEKIAKVSRALLFLVSIMVALQMRRTIRNTVTTRRGYGFSDGVAEVFPDCLGTELMRQKEAPSARALRRPGEPIGKFVEYVGSKRSVNA